MADWTSEQISTVMSQVQTIYNKVMELRSYGSSTYTTPDYICLLLDYLIDLVPDIDSKIDTIDGLS